MTELSVVPGPFRLAKNQPISVEIKIVPGLFVKSMLCVNAGTIVPQHSHVYDHLSVVAAGRVLVWAGDECLGAFNAVTGIEIKANVKHTFRTLVPNTLILCVHRLDENGEVPIAEDHHLNFGEIG